MYDMAILVVQREGKLPTVWPRQNVKPLQTLGLSMQN